MTEVANIALDASSTWTFLDRKPSVSTGKTGRWLKSVPDRTSYAVDGTSAREVSFVSSFATECCCVALPNWRLGRIGAHRASAVDTCCSNYVLAAHSQPQDRLDQFILISTTYPDSPCDVSWGSSWTHLLSQNWLAGNQKPSRRLRAVPPLVPLHPVPNQVDQKIRAAISQ